VFALQPPSDPARRRSWSDTPPMHLKRSNQRFLAAEALRWALSRAQHRAGDGCVVLLLDDLDAVDGASRNAFADVVTEPPLGGALILGAHEPRFDARWPEGPELTLEGLTAHQVAALVESGPPVSLPPRALDVSADAERILPLYVEQLARFAAEGGAAEPPEGLADLIALRIDRLPPDARRMLQATAVLGDRAQESQLRELLPEVEDPHKQLDRLDRAGFTVQHELGIAVSHPFLREVTLVSIPAEVRRRLHGRARHAAADGGPTMPIEAHALHAFQAQESFEALMLLEQVAGEAAERADFDGTVRVLRLGLDLARREMSRGAIEDPLSAILLFSCKLGDALALDGRLWDADGVLREALDLGGPRAEERPRILASLANVAHERGREETAVAYVTDALRIATDQGRLDWIASFERMRKEWSDGSN
jgi:serine/threonine-protein kinase